MVPQLKKENKVYLLIKKIKKEQKSKKIHYIKVKQFFIKVKKENISYKLELAKDAKVYSIVYILLLK